MRNPIGLKTFQTVTFLEGLTSDRAKTPEGLVFIYFGKRRRLVKTGAVINCSVNVRKGTTSEFRQTEVYTTN